MSAHRKYFTPEAIAQGRREACRRHRERNRAELNRRERERIRGNATQLARKAKNGAARRARLTPEQKAARLAYYRDYLKRNPAKKRALTAARNRKRRHGKLAATPSWANRRAIEQIYGLARRREAETGFAWHVDHVVPLRSALVCGLHCETNLAVIPARENCSKRNRYWPDMPHEDGVTGERSKQGSSP